MPASTIAILLGAVYDLLNIFVFPHLPNFNGVPVGTAVGTTLKVLIDDFFPGAV